MLMLPCIKLLTFYEKRHELNKFKIETKNIVNIF